MVRQLNAALKDRCGSADAKVPQYYELKAIIIMATLLEVYTFLLVMNSLL